MTWATDPLAGASDDGAGITLTQARDAIPCLPDGMTLETSTIPQVRAAITACRMRREDARRQAQRDAQARERASWAPAGDARHGRVPGFHGDIATSNLPPQVKAAALEFERAIAAGEIRFGTFAGTARGEITHTASARVYSEQWARDAQRAADIELCQHYATRTRGVRCADS